MGDKLNKDSTGGHAKKKHGTKKKKKKVQVFQQDCTVEGESSNNNEQEARNTKNRHKVKHTDRDQALKTARAPIMEDQVHANAAVNTNTNTNTIRHDIGKNVEHEILSYVARIQELGVEGLIQLFREKLAMICPPQPAANHSFMANPERNRYQDVVCLESTRVVLKYNVPPQTDYIHANWIKFPQYDRQYIATQAPLDNTQGDFWRMVFQEEVPAVINLTKNVEDGKVKCSQYWPLDVGDSKQCEDMFIINKKVDKEANTNFTITVLEVLPEGCSNSHICRLFHFTSWPDRGVATSSSAVLKMIRLIRKEDILATGPVVLHCSAGVGRTGCVMLIDCLLNSLFSGSYSDGVDFVEIFTVMRSQRASSVQNEMQFLFSIMTTLTNIRSRLNKNLRLVADIEEILKNYRKMKMPV